MNKTVDHNLTAITNNAISQLSRLTPLLVCVYLPILLGFVALIIVYQVAGIPLRIFFIDPVAEFNAPMYVGLVSNLGVVCWCIAASVCLFGGTLVVHQKKFKEAGYFLICAGLVSAMMLFDDLYLLHEEVLPERLFLPQELVFVIYGGLVLTFLFRFRLMILNSDFVLLLVSLAFLGGSVLVDALVKPEEFFIFGGFPGRHLIEDGLKIMGIVAWFVYFVRTCYQKVSPLIRPA